MFWIASTRVEKAIGCCSTLRLLHSIAADNHGFRFEPGRRTRHIDPPTAGKKRPNHTVCNFLERLKIEKGVVHPGEFPTLR